MLHEILCQASVMAPAAGGAAALVCRRRPRVAAFFGTAGLLAGCGLAAFEFFRGGGGMMFFFFVPVVLLAVAGGIYALEYIAGYGRERAGCFWLFYNLTVAAMLGVLRSRSPLGFLVCWELMGLASFALVIFDFRDLNVGRAAWIYLLSCEAGGLLLMAMFVMDCAPAGVFFLAAAGFGLKIGFPLLHVWLPLAHPAAPAPVSALMSGAMIQLGFYGIFRWGWPAALDSAVPGWTLLGLGIVGSVGGMLLALPRRNLKALLAYSSIENMGIAAMGFGIGTLGFRYGVQLMMYCGWAGGMLHMLNHSMLKGGLFLGAGAVQHATGSLDIDASGGLLKRMPVSGGMFLLNSAGICGVPPFSGFVSEFLIFAAGICGAASGVPLCVGAGLASVTALALAGGLAGAVFCKAACAFLGEPRSEAAAAAAEVSPLMNIPVAALLIFNMAVTGGAALLLHYYLPAPEAAEVRIIPALLIIGMVSAGTVIFSGALMWLRFRGCAGKGSVRRSCTWDCGYAEPSARMEYTGSSFIQPLSDFFSFLLRPVRRIVPPRGFFPEEGVFEARHSDPVLEGIWSRIFRWAVRGADLIRPLQSGYLHLYVLIITLVLMAMLLWALVLPWGGGVLRG